MQVLAGTHEDELGQTIANWHSQQLKRPVTPPYCAMGFVNDNKPVASAIFNGYTGSAIEIHFFGPNQLNKSVIKAIGNYVFGQLCCNVAIVKLRRNHPTLKKYLPRIGFKYLCVIPQYFGPSKSEDAILYSITREAAKRWYKHG